MMDQVLGIYQTHLILTIAPIRQVRFLFHLDEEIEAHKTIEFAQSYIISGGHRSPLSPVCYSLPLPLLQRIIRISSK